MNVAWTPSSRVLLVCLLFLGGVGWLGTAHAAQNTLAWSDNSDNEDGFKIERKLGTSGTFSQIATTGPNATSYIDSTAAGGTTYCYRVRAFNTVGDSGYTNEACGTTPQVFTLTVNKTGLGTGTVTSSPAGINCGATCAGSYSSGTVVTLTASAGTGSTFTGWSGGGCSGTGTCIVTLATATTVTATFQNALPAAPGNLSVLP